MDELKIDSRAPVFIRFVDVVVDHKVVTTMPPGAARPELEECDDVTCADCPAVTIRTPTIEATAPTLAHLAAVARPAIVLPSCETNPHNCPPPPRVADTTALPVPYSLSPPPEHISSRGQPLHRLANVH